MHYDYPIEQLARGANTRFQLGFARITMHLMPRLDDVVLEPCQEGLKILGVSEVALAMPCDVIRQIHTNKVDLKPPRVRLLQGPTVREPVMWVRASVIHKRAVLVVQDLVRRGAEIEEVDWTLSRPVVRAKAPLRLLLGYPQALATLSQNTADLRMWLSHYASVSPPPDGEAA